MLHTEAGFCFLVNSLPLMDIPCRTLYLPDYDPMLQACSSLDTAQSVSSSSGRWSRARTHFQNMEAFAWHTGVQKSNKLRPASWLRCGPFFPVVVVIAMTSRHRDGRESGGFGDHVPR